MARNIKSVFTALIREPLTQFLLAGAMLFTLYYALQEPVTFDPASSEITVSADQVEILVSRFTRSWGRAPSDAELQAVVEDFVREEISYREALAMGLDQNDPVVRRRMQQKLAFLLEDVEAISEPTDEELHAYLAANKSDYIEPQRISFRQVFVSTNEDDAALRAEQTMAALGNGAAPEELGDATLLPQSMDTATRVTIARTFGDSFADKLSEISLQQWSGPLGSDFGLHLVYVTERNAAREPDFARVRAHLRQALIHERRLAALESLYQQLRSRYQVTIEWPEKPVSKVARAQ